MEIVFYSLGMSNSFFEYPSEMIKRVAVIPPDNEKGAKETGMHPTITVYGDLITAPYLFRFVLEIIKTYNGKLEKNLPIKIRVIFRLH
ncbi:MAG: hypothetical protein EAX90_12970 [Candidatus Heimdallarchaeota archaeon]|nr:hypothetical protein [Candidatus Heimdallarchaeota archaeon]